MYFNPHYKPNKKAKRKRGRPESDDDSTRDYIPNCTLTRIHKKNMRGVAALINPYGEKPNVSRAIDDGCWMIFDEAKDCRKDCYREAALLYNETIERGLNVMGELRLRVGAPARRVHKNYPRYHCDAIVMLIQKYYAKFNNASRPKIEKIETEIEELDKRNYFDDNNFPVLPTEP